MNASTTLTVNSPVGCLALRARDGAIIALDWVEEMSPPTDAPVLHEAARQLTAYFDKALTSFDLPLAPDGTLHQKKVWAAMSDIPFGGLRTYGDLARDIGSSARAVGTACGRNPIPIIVPCHRVVAAGSGIGGYSGRGGLDTKRTLLALEGVGSDR
jgi:methylated-DNA-[protein]-cysteine S-methyltransferase